MPKALITGIAGFAGLHLAELLKGNGYDLIGVDVNLEYLEDREADYSDYIIQSLDILEEEHLESILSESRPDEVYHLAAIAHVPSSYVKPKSTIEINVLGTLNVLEAVLKVCPSAKVLFVGSASIYGHVRSEDIPIDENVQLRPADPYSVSKAAGDLLAFQYSLSEGLHVVRVRPFNHIGPRQQEGYAATDFARQIVEIEKGLKDPVLKVGNLDARRDFSDVRDVIRGYWKALSMGEKGAVYNICSGNAISIHHLLKLMLDESGIDIEIEQDPLILRPSDIPILQGDYSLLRDITGWNPEISIRQTVADILDDWRVRVG